MIIDSPIISGSYAATGSLDQVGNVVITGSLTVTEQITGSINTASFAAFAISASNALTASYLSNYIPPFPYTGSAGISGSLSVNGDITASGAIVAQTLYVQTITSSVDFVTGSTRFGSELTNTHLFTGSVTITGSLAVNGSTAILTNQTGAMSVATASYVANAVSASFSQTAISASYASNVPATASFAVSASNADTANSATTAVSASWITGSNVVGTVASATSASFAQTAISASYASNVPATASFAVSASQAESASYALTASFASNVPATSSFAVSASQAQNAVSAAYSAYALTSSYSLAGSGFPFSGSAVITGSLLITNLSSSGVSYLVADSTGFITAQSGSAAIFQTQIYTASAGQTTFNITNGYATGLINVFVNGTKLNPSEYNDTNGTTIVLATGSFVDDIVEFNKYLPASGVTNNSLRQQTTFTASAGQTVFSASYTPGLLDIFYNGSRLSGNEYTANNGTFITLATGSAEGDILDVFVYSYQVGAFSGIGGAGVANEISYFNTTNSITSSAAITISGTNAIVTGSLLGTASYAANANLLDGLDSSVFVPTGSFNTFSSSILTYTGSADSRLSSLETTSGSNITRIAALEVTSGSNITRLGALETASGSAITRLSALEVTSGSNITRLGALETASGSAITRLSSIESTTGSLNTASGSAITRLNSLESKTGSYATTGSNIFVDGQYLSSSFNPTGFSTTASLYTDGGLRVSRDAYISGTLYLNNVTVFGTQSVAYISSSQLNIGTNLITVNTDTPSIRFGGLAVYDSGSTGLTGSILWDSETNHWIYSNPSGSTYSGGMFISGPRTSTLGSETGTTSNALMKGQGGDHITSSAIFENGASASFYTNALVVSASGDTQFGSVINNTHQFTGSVSVSGSIISSSPITGSGFSTTANVNLGNFDLTSKYLISDGSAGLGGVISIRQDATYLPKGNGYSSIASSPSVFEFYGYTGASTYKNFTFRFNGLTDNTRRDYTLPDADGTLALTSNLSSYLPLSGGTLSGLVTITGAGTGNTSEGIFFKRTSNLLQGGYINGNGGVLNIVATDEQNTSNGNILFQRFNGSTVTESMRITSNGYFKASNTGDYSWTSATNPHHDIFSNNVSNTTLHVASTSNDYSGTTLALGVLRSANSAYNLLAAYSGNGTTPFSSLRFIVRGDGYVGMGTTDFTTQNGNVGNIFKIVSNNNNVIIGETSTTARSLILENRRTSRSGGARNVQLILGGDSNDNGYFSFQTADTGAGVSERLQITATGVVQPGANGTQDLGTSSLRWGTIYTSDLSLSNGIGDYTIVEGENDLFLYNNKQNKVYKFVIEEVDPSIATPKKS